MGFLVCVNNSKITYSPKTPTLQLISPSQTIPSGKHPLVIAKECVLLKSDLENWCLSFKCQYINNNFTIPGTLAYSAHSITRTSNILKVTGEKAANSGTIISLTLLLLIPAIDPTTEATDTEAGYTVTVVFSEAKQYILSVPDSNDQVRSALRALI
jgi:hypothetical protein